MAGEDRLLLGEEPPPLERVSLDGAGTMFVREKNRKAVEMLVNRGRLRVWPQKNEEGTTIALWTTREWLKEFVNSGPRTGRLRADLHTPDDRDRQIAVLNRVVNEQSREILRLQLLVADFEVRRGVIRLGDRVQEGPSPASTTDVPVEWPEIPDLPV